MATLRIGIIMHGVTGRMGMNQHLIRSIVEIRKQGGVTLANGDRLLPDPILVGRNAEKIAVLARHPRRSHGAVARRRLRCREVKAIHRLGRDDQCVRVGQVREIADELPGKLAEPVEHEPHGFRRATLAAQRVVARRALDAQVMTVWLWSRPRFGHGSKLHGPRLLARGLFLRRRRRE